MRWRDAGAVAVEKKENGNRAVYVTLFRMFASMYVNENLCVERTNSRCSAFSVRSGSSNSSVLRHDVPTVSLGCTVARRKEKSGRSTRFGAENRDCSYSTP